MLQPWKLLKTELAFKGWRSISYKTFLHPKGHEVIVDVLESHEDASVIAITTEGKVVIAGQFRCGPEEVMDELTGGKIDDEETPEQAAIRELAEEGGYAPGNMEYLGYLYREAWRTGRSHYFLATDCIPLPSGPQPDDFEVIEVKNITIAELIENAKNARMTDTGGVLLAYDRLKQLEEKYETTN